MKKWNLQDISLKSLLANNKFILCLSLFLAILFWCSTAIKVSPIEKKTVSDVKVQFDLSIPSQSALLPFSPIDNVTIDVTIQGKKSKLNTAEKDMIVAKVDCSEVSSSGTYTIPINISIADQYASDFEIVGATQNNTRVWFDTLSEGQSNVAIEISGKEKVAEGYVIGQPALSTDLLTYSGPTQFFNQVKKIVARTAVPEGAKEAVTVEPTVIALDENNSVVDHISFTYGEQSKLSLVIPVLKRATLPLGATFLNAPTDFTEDKLPMVYSPTSLSIAASESYLKSTNRLPIGSIDFTKLTPGVNVIEFPLKELNLKDVLVTDDTVDKVTVTIDLTGYTVNTFSIGQSNIQLTNVPAGYTATLVNTTMENIGVIEPPNTTISAGDIYAVVDLTNARTDKNNYGERYTAKVTLKNKSDCWVVGSYTTYVNLTKNS